MHIIIASQDRMDKILVAIHIFRNHSKATPEKLQLAYWPFSTVTGPLK